MTPAEITAFLATPGKTLEQAAPVPLDGLNYRQKVVRFSILNAQGRNSGLTFGIHYSTSDPLDYRLTLDSPRSIWRVNCNPSARVTNKFTSLVPGIIKGRINGRHYFSWEDNIHAATIDHTVNHLRYARPLDPALTSFDDICNWFMKQVYIAVPNWDFKPSGVQ